MPTVINNEPNTSAVTAYTGRRVIYTDYAEVDDSNIISVVEDAYTEHLRNRSDIKYLYDYYRGLQPILWKVKKVRPEINERVVINLANEIVAFIVGYRVGKPVQYISSSADSDVSAAVAALNDMMRNEGKVTKDRKLVEWQAICGTAYRIVLPKSERGTKFPVRFYTMNPMNTFCIYANDFTEEQLVGVSYRQDKNQNITFTAYTKDAEYRWTKGLKDFVKNPLPTAGIPIIEYPANSARLGAFEVVITILDEINELDSGRMDAIRQFVESLLVIYNAEFEDGVTANEIREAGMVQLRSTNESPADIKVISEHLDQTNTETLKQSLIKMVHEIVGMPSQGDGSTGDSSNNGAIILKNGWKGAETRAEDFEAMFYEPEKAFLRIVADITETQNALSFDPDDIDIKFTRRNYEDILSKSQTLITLLQNPWVHPAKAYEASSLFVDNEEAFQMGMEWHESQARAKEPQEEVTDESAAD